MIPSPRSVVSLAQALPHADADLASLVGEADRHAVSVLTGAYVFGLDVLGDIVLPPGAEARVDRDQMRALGALYLAADLESARVIASVETLAGLAVTGAIHMDFGAAAPLLHKFWRQRNERIDATERTAFFGRLFGASYGPAPADGFSNMDFEPLMLELCEALYRLDELSSNPVHGGIAQQSRLRAAARNIISNLVMAGGGVTAFLAAEILALIKEALAILTHEHLRGIFMARDVWGVVAAINRLARVHIDDPRGFVRRGRAGMNVIVWLGDAADALGQHGRPLVRLDHPVVPAAIDWLQTSLSISERQGRTNVTPPGFEPMQASQWADIGI